MQKQTPQPEASKETTNGYPPYNAPSSGFCKAPENQEL
jgi:hypothetical protein